MRFDGQADSRSPLALNLERVAKMKKGAKANWPRVSGHKHEDELGQSADIPAFQEAFMHAPATMSAAPREFLRHFSLNNRTPTRIMPRNPNADAERDS